MSNTYFDFKQFRVLQDRSAMKVGTDGVLLGAWAEACAPKNILDVGTGTGLIALMLAQRYPNAQIVGIDIVEEAVEEATLNFNNAPFSKQLTALRSSIEDYTPQRLFDLIVCNPPFYEEQILPPSAKRSIARNVSSLPFSSLISAVKPLLTKEGKFQVIIPFGSVATFVHLCWENNLYLYHQTDVRTKTNKPTKRSLLAFSSIPTTTSLHDKMLLMNEDGSRSTAYRTLTQDFYLR